MVNPFTFLFLFTSFIFSTSAFDSDNLDGDDDDDDDDDDGSSFPTSIFFILGLLFFLFFLIALIRIIRQWKYGEAMAGLYNAPAAVVVTTTGGGGPNGSINPRRPILRRPAMNVATVPTIAVVEVVGRPEGAPPTYEESVTVPPGGGFSYVSF